MNESLEIGAEVCLSKVNIISFMVMSNLIPFSGGKAKRGNEARKRS